MVALVHPHTPSESEVAPVPPGPLVSSPTRLGTRGSHLLPSEAQFGQLTSPVAQVVRVLVFVAHLTLVTDHVRALAEADGVLTGAHHATSRLLLNSRESVNVVLCSLLLHVLVELQAAGRLVELLTTLLVLFLHLGQLDHLELLEFDFDVLVSVLLVGPDDFLLHLLPLNVLLGDATGLECFLLDLSA